MSTYSIRTTALRPRLAMPVCATLGSSAFGAAGVVTWGQADAARMHVAASVKGATQGTSVWSSPPS